MFERKQKYLVFKWDDIGRGLTNAEKSMLTHLQRQINTYRRIKGKKELSGVFVSDKNAELAEKVWRLIEEYDKTSTN